MTGIELEQMESHADLISENTLIDHEAIEKETNPQPEQFRRYVDFLDALGGDHDKAMKMWTDMLAKRDEWPLI